MEMTPIKSISEIEWRKRFVEKLNYRMDLCGINQKELAKLIGISESAMSNYMRCKRTPRIDVIARMSHVLGCTTDYLINVGYYVDVR